MRFALGSMSPLLIVVSLMFGGLAIASAWNSVVNVSRDGIPLEAWNPGQFIITDENAPVNPAAGGKL